MPRESHSEGSGGPVRFALGMAQMFGAVTGLVLLLLTGLSPATVVTVAVTSMLALTSRVLVRRRRRGGS